MARQLFLEIIHITVLFEGVNMRCRAILILILMATAPTDSAREAGDQDLQRRVETIIAELGDPQPAVRERADLKLRNLPLPAHPIVTRLYAKQKESLDPEARGRIENS